MKKIYEIYVDFINGIMEADKPIKLVQNDNDSVILRFKVKNDIDTSRKVFKAKFPDGSCYIEDLVNNEIELSVGFLHYKGNIKYELSIYNNDNRLTDFAIGTLLIREELVDEDSVIELDDRLPILTQLINEVREIEENARISEIDGGISNTDYDNGGGA